MKVLLLNTPLILKLVPRKYPILSDSLVLTLRNEATNTIITPEITFTTDNYLNISILNQPNDFKAQNKYEITVKNGSEIIYMGKLIVLEEGTDVQNYEYKTQNNEYFRFKE
jgi:hypothetical protein